MTIIMTAATAWFIAQAIKIIIAFINTKKLDITLLMKSGGMPSSHSAFVTAAAVKMGIIEGMMSPLFGVCVVIAFVVMYDAVGVRQSVGIHAKALNKINNELCFIGNRMDFDLIKEVCGHNIFQVIVGCLLGITVGFAV